MLTFKFNTDIFAENANVLVNPINTVGTMGAGLALEFKRRYPLNFNAYRQSCRDGTIKVGKVFTTYNQGPNNLTIMNLPTKLDWREGSRIEYIEAGLDDLVSQVTPGDIVALPALGCGLGGLNTYEVMDLMTEKLTPVKDVQFIACICTSNWLSILL